ncbi:MAG: leucine-rich repeat domain-containing protein, partial [Saprospiraceae bacterium]|nr:leucine-rich repeat domain-containing protein [Saprospiraceae bacterium]
MKRAYRLQDAIQNPQVTELFLNHQGLKAIPKEVFQLTQLTKLDISYNQIKAIPAEIGYLSQLENLNLSNNKIKAFPEEIHLTKLQKLNLSHNQLQGLPMIKAKQLTELRASHNALEELPVIKSLKRLFVSHNFIKKILSPATQMLALQVLEINHNHVSRLPKNIENWQALEKLEANYNHLAKLPEAIGQLKQLRILRIKNNRLRKLPDTLGQCDRLRILEADKNKLSHLPKGMEQLQWLAYLSLSNNNLKRVSTALVQHARLREIDLSRNEISHLPKGMEQLEQLFRLQLANNQLKNLPKLPQSLTHLDVSKNHFEKVPDSILQLQKLEELNLSQNQIQQLPGQWAHLKQLKAIYLQGNPIREQGTEVFQLKKLEKTQGLFDRVERKYFQKIQAYANQKQLSAATKNQLFELLRQPVSEQEASPEIAMHLLNLGIQDAQYRGRAILFRETETLRLETSQLVVLGRLHQSIKWWRSKLENEQISIGRKPKQEGDYILLVGNKPGSFESYLAKAKGWISEQQLCQYLQQQGTFYLFSQTEPSAVERIQQMLLHEDIRNVKMGLELVRNGGCPQALYTPLAMLYLTHPDEEIRKTALNIIALYLSDAHFQLLRYPKRIWQNNEARKKQFRQRLV